MPTKKIITNNSYALLLLMLNPQKSAKHLKFITEAIHQKKINWEALLYQANLQMCTPLWLAQLKKDQLLHHLPDGLAEYLTEIYRANEQRNQELKKALIKLLEQFNTAAIDTLLIKGAATFCDDLYGDMGSRFMGDLDILIPTNKIKESLTIIQTLGYQEIPDEGMEKEGLPTDERHHQLPRHFIPGTPVVVEIHFKVSYALVGRMITPEEAWQTSCPASLEGHKTSVLSVEHKLLLNTAHALIPHREFLRGAISPLQLTEFTLLAQRYTDANNWQHWINKAKQFSLQKEFACYCHLANKYMGLLLPPELEQQEHSIANEKRILFVGNYLATLKKNKIPLAKKLIYTLYKLQYIIKLPHWMWQNPCYASGKNTTLIRLYVCLKKPFNNRSWKNI